MHPDASLFLNLLFGPLRVLLSHVHDSCCLRTVALIAMQAFEVFSDLVCSPSRLANFPRALILQALSSIANTIISSF